MELMDAVCCNTVALGVLILRAHVLAAKMRALATQGKSEGLSAYPAWIRSTLCSTLVDEIAHSR